MVLLFDEILLYVREIISAVGVIVIAMGTLRATIRLVQSYFNKEIASEYIRWELGESIILGLEFMVGADIIGSLVKPDYYTLGMLAIIVAVRTVLSYFLNLELATVAPKKK